MSIYSNGLRCQYPRFLPPENEFGLCKIPHKPIRQKIRAVWITPNGPF